MVKWFDRTPRDVTRQLLRPRAPVVGERVALQSLRPDPAAFLGQALALQIVAVRQAGRALDRAPTAAARVTLTEVVRIAAARAGELSRLLESDDLDPVAAVASFEEAAQAFDRRSDGADWYELLLSIHVTSGMLSDFFVAYAGGLPDEDKHAVLRALRAESMHDALRELLASATAGNPRLASKLAVWGRSLVGDTLLQMYLAVNGPDEQGRAVPSQSRLEPAFNDIVASHTRRMDELGLTA